MSNRFTHKGYQAQYEWDEDGKFYHGQITNLTDIITFQAKTLDKLVKEMIASVEDYLKFCQENSPSHFGPYGASELRPERLYLA